MRLLWMVLIARMATGAAPEQVIAGPFKPVGGDAQRVFVLSKAGVFAIDKQTKVKTLVTAAGAGMTKSVGVGINNVYLVLPKQLVRVPLP